MIDEVSVNTSLAMVEKSYVTDLNSGTLAFYTSMKGNTDEEKAKLFNAMNNPDHRISDMIGKTITVKDVFVEEVEMVNEETGEIVKAPRIVVIDVKGESYQAVSVGVMSAFKKLFQLFGAPTWEKGIPLEVRQLKKGKNNILTFAIPTK